MARLAVLSSLLVALLGVSTPLFSQTVMINAGQDINGTVTYFQAFQYDFVDDKPSFPGGDSKFMEFINQNREYPMEAYNKGIQGRVTCAFVVNTDGSVSNISLLRSVNVLLDEEAMRIFSLMPNWTPGRKDGRPVPVRVVKSINFKK